MKEKDIKPNILVFAHRGASKEFPENTLSSFTRAADLGVDFIETDLHFTRDGRFAVIHDDSIDRVTNGTGRVADYTLKELKEFNAGYFFTMDGGRSHPFRGMGLEIMSLEELLNAFPAQRFNMDLKDNNRSQVKHFVDVIDRFNAHGRIIAASKHFGNLQVVRRMRPQIPTSFSMPEFFGIYFLYKSGFLFLDINFKGIALQVPEKWGQLKIVTMSFIKQMHEKGIYVHVWTINSEEDMKRLVDLGVDGIMSDDPALLLRVLGR